ncbi:CBS domain-containing protein [Ideonella sp. YS5]|uniref:CBS domain-containing protein n=1 Tax=Ideonella sp. YS5 TaxID=3453714 RepID=UPI003EEE9606
MGIASIAQRRVVTIDVHASLREVARLMEDRHVGAVVVTQADGVATRLVGVITDRDLALLVVAKGRSVHTQVGDALGANPVSIPVSASTAEAAQAMRDAGVRRLLLVDSEDRLAGIVTLDDLIASYADQLDDLSQALERGLEQEVDRGAGDAGQAGEPPVVVPPDVAATWRRVFEP